LTTQSYEASEANLQRFLEGRNNATSQTVKTIDNNNAGSSRAGGAFKNI
jgi:hypothetical protein